MLPPSHKLLLVTAGVSLLLLCLVASRRRSSEVIVSHTSLEEPDGVPPPAPRTVAGWAAYHGALAAEVAKAKAAGGVDFVLYGDSITESFRGTAVGMPADSYAGNAAAWRRRMAGRRALILAISGDETLHLLWRLRHGEGPRGLHPAVVTLMISTNDLFRLTMLHPEDEQRVVSEAASRAERCVRELQRQAPQARLVVFGVLPIQPRGRSLPPFAAKVAAVNERLQALAEGHESMRFKDCGWSFMSQNGTLDFSLMPDGVHPAGKGGEVLLACMLEAIYSASS